MSDQGPDRITCLYRVLLLRVGALLTSGHCSDASKLSFIRNLAGGYGEENLVNVWDEGADPPHPFPGVRAYGCTA